MRRGVLSTRNCYFKTMDYKFLIFAFVLANACVLNVGSQAVADEGKGGFGVACDDRMRVGWVEPLKLFPEGILIDAKLTPGSEGNVLHAERVKKISKDGKRVVRFDVPSKNGGTQTLEREILGTKNYRTTRGRKVKRYTVKFGICIAQVYQEIEFALADRSDFEQAARIGRAHLAGHFIIDPGRVRSTTPSCKKR